VGFAVLPTGLAVAAITTAGSAGILIGPAGVGFVAHVAGLPAAFWILAALMGLVTFSARIVTATPRQTVQPFSPAPGD
jgi:MFS family permease